MQIQCRGKLESEFYRFSFSLLSTDPYVCFLVLATTNSPHKKRCRRWSSVNRPRICSTSTTQHRTSNSLPESQPPLCLRPLQLRQISSQARQAIRSTTSCRYSATSGWGRTPCRLPLHRTRWLLRGSRSLHQRSHRLPPPPQQHLLSYSRYLRPFRRNHPHSSRRTTCWAYSRVLFG